LSFADSQSNAEILLGTAEARIVLAGTVSKGDALGYSGGWVRALATAAGVIQIRCVAGEDGVSGQTIVAYFDKTIIGGARFSGGTVNGKLYVAEGTDVGEYTQTAPSTATDANTEVGVMISATEAMVQPAHTADSVVA